MNFDFVLDPGVGHADHDLQLGFGFTDEPPSRPPHAPDDATADPDDRIAYSAHLVAAAGRLYWLRVAVERHRGMVLSYSLRPAAPAA
jgi:hypothetical protein